MFKNKKGFTLIELLVVIAIIGILSSVVLASLNSARKKGRDARRIADIKQLQLALELYYDANGAYPAAISGTLLTAPGYIAAVPKDPTTQIVYPYDYLSTGSSYCVGANLETAGHSALQSDADCTGTNITSGSPTDDVSCTGVASLYCYQVKP